MHYITVPESIMLKAPQSTGGGNLSTEPRTFINWALEVILNDPRGCEGGPIQMRRWSKVIEKFEKYDKPGNVLVLEDEDHRKLTEIANNPGVKYTSITNVQLLPFFEAITEAAQKDPRPKDQRNDEHEEKTTDARKRKAS